jgi:hypothetical protein
MELIMATWTIENLERNVADGGVTVAHWRVTETETVGEGDDAVTYSASSYGTVSFTPDASADGFIAFDALTEANVLGWVYEEVDQAETEAALAADIAGQKTPVTTDGVPW